MPNEVNTTVYATTFLDRDGEKSTTSVSNKTFADFATFSAASAAFQSAIDTVTNGTRFKQVLSAPGNLASQVKPTNNSFREDKWLVRFEDNVTFERGSFTIPTADPSTVTLIPGEDLVDMSSGPGNALKAGIEGFVVSKAGNDVTVLEIEYVGRNI